MHTNIFAHTAADAIYPEYISVNERDDGKVYVAVRSPPYMVGNEARQPGATAEMCLGHWADAQLMQLAAAINQHLARRTTNA